MIQITRWRPDTCKCSIEYSWDDSLEIKDRVHSAHRVVSACAAHVEIPDKFSHYSVLTDENSRKNKFLSAIIENIPEARIEKTQEDGTVVKELKPGLEYSYSFDADRNLIVDLKGFPEKAKSDALGIAQTAFPDKIQIENVAIV